MLLNPVSYTSAIGTARENGDNYSPVPGEQVIIGNIDGQASILFSKKLPSYNSATTPATLGTIPYADDFQDNYNFSPLPSTYRSDGSTPQEQLPGDRLITNDRGSLFGLLRSGSFIAKAAPLAQVFLSKIDNLVRVVYRNMEEFGESLVRVSVNLRGRLYNYRGVYSTQANSADDSPVLFEVDGDVAAGMEARDGYLDTDVSGVPSTDQIKTLVIPLYDVNGNEIGQRHREVYHSDGSFSQEALDASNPNTANAIYSLSFGEWSITVANTSGSSAVIVDPLLITISSNGQAVATFDGNSKTITLETGRDGSDGTVNILTNDLTATVGNSVTITCGDSSIAMTPTEIDIVSPTVGINP